MIPYVEALGQLGKLPHIMNNLFKHENMDEEDKVIIPLWKYNKMLTDLANRGVDGMVSKEKYDELLTKYNDLKADYSKAIDKYRENCMAENRLSILEKRNQELIWEKERLENMYKTLLSETKKKTWKFWR